MSFQSRLESPAKGNKYYMTKSAGGYSSAITGKCKSTGKADPNLNVLANCVGYAYGRFNEIGQYGKCKYLKPVNAENFPENASGCKTGTVPKYGAVIVWQKGKTLSKDDGAGHVAIVEEIISDTEITISQSGYNSKTFWTEKCTKTSTGWQCSWMDTNYKFRCFIYNPAVTDNDLPILSLGAQDKYVKLIQAALNKQNNATLTVDGSFGKLTQDAIKQFQQANKLSVTGQVDDATYTALGIIKESPRHWCKINNKLININPIIQNKVVYISISDLQHLGLVKSYSYNNKTGNISLK